MKTTFFPLLAACVTMGLCGCQKSTPETPQTLPAGAAENSPGHPCQICVRVETPLSKVAAAAVQESRVASLQVLVFRPDGIRELYASSDESSLTLECTVGSKIFWAFTNVPSLQSAGSLDELASFVFPLSAVTPDALPMKGSCQTIISQHGSLNIEVSRMVCKIVLNDVLTRLGTAWEGKHLNFSRIYLTNAVSGTLPDGSIQSWANKIQYAGECSAVVAENSPSANAWQMDATDSLRFARVFFAFPNPTEADSFSASWSPRYTRLVLEGALTESNGDAILENVYYPIPIANLQANHCYVVNRYTIFRPGLDTPGADPSLLNTEVSVTVKDWDATHTINEHL